MLRIIERHVGFCYCYYTYFFKIINILGVCFRSLKYTTNCKKSIHYTWFSTPNIPHIFLEIEYLGFVLSHIRDVSQISNCPHIPPNPPITECPLTLSSFCLGFPPVPARGQCTIRPRAVPVLTRYGQMRLLHLPSPVSTLVRQICKLPDFATPESRITACFWRCSLRGKSDDFFTHVGSRDFTSLSPVRKQ